MYKTWFMSKMVAYSIHTPLYDRYAYNWIIERFNATQDSSAIIYLQVYAMYTRISMEMLWLRTKLSKFNTNIFWFGKKV